MNKETWDKISQFLQERKKNLKYIWEYIFQYAKNPKEVNEKAKDNKSGRNLSGLKKSSCHYTRL